MQYKRDSRGFVPNLGIFLNIFIPPLIRYRAALSSAFENLISRIRVKYGDTRLYLSLLKN